MIFKKLKHLLRRLQSREYTILTRINIVNNPLNNINPVENNRTQKNYSTETSKFESIISQKILNEQGITFSKHSSIRMDERNTDLSLEQSKRLLKAFDMAKQKGLKDTLVLLDNYAFIVNVPSKVVVTAVDKASLKDRVFTNINGAVIA